MLKIGDFSKASHSTVKTLRYYSEIGLLMPSHVDKFTGYRYYSPSQLNEIARINQLKSVGFSLTTIKTILQNELSEDEMKVLYEKQIAVTENEIAAARAKVVSINQMITNLSKEPVMEEVRIESLPEVIVASKRLTIPVYDALYQEAPAMGKIMEKHGAVCSEPAYCFNIYHDKEYRETDIDIEICEAVTEKLPDGDGLVYKVVESVQNAAVINHRGPYESLSDSYGMLYKWIDENGYEQIDLCRESYIDGIWNKEDPQEWLTVIQIPVQKK